MTDRSAPDDSTLPTGPAVSSHDGEDALLLAYVDGTLALPVRAEFEARLAGDPALRAEVDGLQALRTLLDGDAEFGRVSLVDVPPPHLLDAIVRAEVLARPDEIRQAVALARSAPATATKPPFWARLQSWWMGGGVVVGAAAAVLFVVSRPAEPPVMTAAAPAAVDAVDTADEKAVRQQVEAQLGKNKKDTARGDPGANDLDGARLPVTPEAVPAADAVPEANAESAGFGGGLAATATAQPTTSPPPPTDATDAAPREAERRAAEGRAGAARDLDGNLGGSLDDEAAPDALGALAERKQKASEPASPTKPAPRADSRANVRDDAFAAPAAEAPAPVTAPSPSSPSPSSSAPKVSAPPPPPAPPTSVGSGGYQSADDASSAFLEKLRAKKSAQVKREEAMKTGKGSVGAEKGAEKGAGKDTPAKGAPPAARSGPAAKGDSAVERGADKSAREMTPSEARDEIERQKRIDAASMMLTTAERELAAGHAQNALDLAVRAEASAGSALGLVPASTQVRAHLSLQRYADAARVGSRLLQGDVADVVIVDGLIAGADAATAVGDRRLAERMLLKALAPANKDKARRALAQQRLDGLRAADVRNRAAYESDAAADAPAAASKSAAPADEP